ncbi:MAG: ferrous iron transport protein A [Clostridia bacterium]|nr:ferrous iron transport protein A [Clostridia bacterium]
MPIRMAPIGEEVEIKRVSTDERVKRHLENLGLAVGQRITVMSSDGGAVILRVKDGRIALDKQMASGIFIACV